MLQDIHVKVDIQNIFKMLNMPIMFNTIVYLNTYLTRPKINFIKYF